MSGSANDNAIQVGVIFVICENHDAFFYVYCPDSKDDHSVLFVSVGLYKIIIKSFDGLALNIVKSFHAFFLAGDGMDIFEPGCSA